MGGISENTKVFMDIQGQLSETKAMVKGLQEKQNQIHEKLDQIPDQDKRITTLEDRSKRSDLWAKLIAIPVLGALIKWMVELMT